MLAGILLLSACQNSEPKKVSEINDKPHQTVEMKIDGTFPYPNLLAENDQTYSLLVIAEKEDHTPVEDDQKISKAATNILSLPTLAMVKEIYPKLPIDNKSAYLLFDDRGLVHQSKSLQNLKSYLEKKSLN